MDANERPAARRIGTTAGVGSFERVLAMRLAPGEDVLPSMHRLLDEAGIRSGIILSGVASLEHASLRNIYHFPEQWPIQEDMRRHTTVPGPLEILAMQGNVAPKRDGSLVIHCHLDFSLGTPPGVTYGGHLMEDTIVGTTAEIYIAEIGGLSMRREFDEETQTYEIAIAEAGDGAAGDGAAGAGR